MNATLLRRATCGIAALLLLAAPSGAQDLGRGEQLYELCAQCHRPDGGGNEAALAPAIAGLPDWYVGAQLLKFQAGGRGMNFHDIGGMRMRPMAKWLSDDEDVANVAAYVAAMPKTWPAPTLHGGNPEAGKQKYTPCIACHGPEGLGNQALNAPPLVGMSDWYQLTSLKNFKAGVRGTSPKDPTGALMRPMALTLPDEQAMLDVIAYIETLSGE